jgi:growth arrest-specific protein 8
MAAKKGKKGAKKGKKGGKKEVAGDDGGPSIDSLKEIRNELRNQLKNDKERRNFYQLERDKINTFWEISKKNLEDFEADLRNKDREREELLERHSVETKVYKQKLKHLLFEEQNELTHIKTEEELRSKLKDDEHREAESEVKTDKRDLKKKLKEMERSHDAVLHQLKMENDRAVTEERKRYEREAKELQARVEKKMKVLRENLETVRRDEVRDLETRKNNHINEIMKKHQKALADIKNYYNDITHNNLDLIRSLKEEVAEMKKKEAKNEKQMLDLARENKRLSEPLTTALKSVDELAEQLEAYEKDKVTLAETKGRLRKLEKRFGKLSWEHEVMQQRTSFVQKERTQLKDGLNSAVFDIQQKAGFTNLLMEKKRETLVELVEKKEAQFAEVLNAAQLEPATASEVNRSLDEIVDYKNAEIGSLQEALRGITAKHNEVLEFYEGKLADYGIPAEELGFRPLVSTLAE